MDDFCRGFAFSLFFLSVPLAVRWIKDSFRAGVSFDDD